MKEPFPEHAADCCTLVELLRARARRRPGRCAYTFLRDGEAEEVSLTYAELEARARAVAASLQASGAFGERALLLFPPGLEFITAFFGCLYAGTVAVPTSPPRPNRSFEPLQTMAADAQAAFALTTSTLLNRIKPVLNDVPGLKGLRWLATDICDEEKAAEWKEPAMGRDTLAFLQYTSGSTAAPKGVMVSHGNLLHNEALIRRAFRQTGRSVVVGWLPLHHDMGLIGNVFQPLYAGATCVLMSPAAFLQRPLRWLRAVSLYRATTSGGPNFAYDLCARKITDEERAGLDLSCWEVAFNGAEPVRHETLERFVAAFGPCGFRREAFQPCYGLAEATLFVAGEKNGSAPALLDVDPEALARNRVAETSAGRGARKLVGCGRPPAELKVVVTHPEHLTACPADQVGEVWVSGPSVAQGYWGRPVETRRTLRAHHSDTGEGPFLRTGDLGFLRDGKLFVVGRLKDLIIIRGRNHYPQDIELTVERSHPALSPNCGAAFSVEACGEERLVVVQELERRAGGDLDEVIAVARRAVAEAHEVQVYAVVLVEPLSIPKTSSGKIRRRACREKYLAGGLRVIKSSVLEGATTAFAGVSVEAGEEGLTRGDLLAASREGRRALAETYLHEQTARVLRVAPSRVDSRQPLSAFGLDSLMAVDLKHRIEVDLGIDFPVVSLLEGQSIAQIARELSDAALAAGSSSSASPAAQDAFTWDWSARNTFAQVAPERAAPAEHPLSHGQASLWLMRRLAPESAAYNVSFAARVGSHIDLEALRRAFRSLVERHPALRTTYDARGGQPVQRIHERTELRLDEEDASTWGVETLKRRLAEEADRAFDLERGPVIRVKVFTRAADDHLLLLAAHHIAVDLWSLVVLLDELRTFYAARRNGGHGALPAPRAQYTDYVRWQTAMLESEEGGRLLEYWRKQLGGGLPALDLPTDRPRPPAQTFRGASHAFSLDEELTGRLKALAKREGTTLYTVLLAAFQTLLHRYTGQEEVVVGSPAACRSRAEFAGVVGYFVNMLALRADLSGDPTFTAFVRRARRTVLDALEHQDYPFPLLVERLQPARDASRPPVFQTVFVLEKPHRLVEDGVAPFVLGEGGAVMRLGPLALESLSLERRVSQFDLTLMAAENGQSLSAALQYNTDLFEPETAARMAEHFRVLLEGVADDPKRRLSELPLLTDGERRRILVEWNESATGYPRDACVHALFEEQAARTPDAVALLCEDERVTYEELNRSANQVAHHLQALGVRPEARVGVLMERSVEMIVALLAVLKAGGAYVPLDAEYPAERLSFMIEDAGLGVLLAQERLTERLPRHGARVVDLERERQAIKERSTENPESRVGPEHLAYVIYTSGSTGRPKGVAVNHRAVVRLVKETDYVGFGPDEVFLQLAPVSFDASTFEVWGSLLNGARLVVFPPGAPSPAELGAALRRDGITTLWLTAGLFHLMVDERVEDLRGVRQLLAGGDVLSAAHVRKALGAAAGARVTNGYGPTEATTFTCCHTMTEAGQVLEPVPIGRPIANTEVYVLDKHLKPVPAGVTGELYIGGDGLARGYLNRPALTAERFVPHPFSAGPGARVYRTGDLVRWLADGRIEFLGRLDNQVKVRGFRIELGEIESALSRHEGVRECVVTARGEAAADKRLVAYVVPERGGPPPPADQLRGYLKKKLPEYMIPSAFVSLAELPLTPNGKVDRGALPAPDGLRPALETAYEPPRTELERAVAGVWQEALGVERVGAHDNFFDLGGHSLLLAQVHSRLREVLRREVSMVEMFQYTTVSSLAQHLSRKTEDGAVTEKIHERVETRRRLMARLQSRQSPVRVETGSRLASE